MPATPTALAPWPGGENTLREAAGIADNEVSLAQNLEFTTDGTAVSRPAIVNDSAGPAGLTGALVPLGYFVAADGTTSLVVADAANSYLYNLATKAWTTIWAFPASGFVQYLNNAVMISESVSGGYWEAGAFTATTTMPLGSQIVFYQDRFWAFGPKGTANQNTVWFSDLTVISPPSTIYNWTVATNFFIVGPGDGQWISAMRADPSALLIFRNLSTWSFQFPSSPALGTLRRLSSTIGTDAVFSVVPYENYYFVLNQGYLYQFINYQYYPLNTKKEQLSRSALPNGQRLDFRLGVLGGRVLVWFLGTMYAFNVITGSWSRWVSPTTQLAHLIQAPPDPTRGDGRVSYGVTGENDAAKAGLFRVQEDQLAVGSGESFDVILRTKSYAFQQASEYKRMTYWTVEVTSADGVTGNLYPEALGSAGATWDQLSLQTWDQLSTGTWDNPLVIPVTITDMATFPSLAPIGITAKMTLSGYGRFLRMQFEIRKTIDGTTATAPFRIRSLTAYLLLKARTSKKVS
jgi:hypothetical protein